MSKFTQDEVNHLAQLSGLELSSEETEAMTADLDAILRYVEKLGSLDTTGVEPTYQVSQIRNVGRDDVAAESAVSRDTILALAPESYHHHIKVPKVL